MKTYNYVDEEVSAHCLLVLLNFLQIQLQMILDALELLKMLHFVL
jgi:hypothetical protein